MPFQQGGGLDFFFKGNIPPVRECEKISSGVSAERSEMLGSHHQRPLALTQDLEN